MLLKSTIFTLSFHLEYIIAHKELTISLTFCITQLSFMIRGTKEFILFHLLFHIIICWPTTTTCSNIIVGVKEGQSDTMRKKASLFHTRHSLVLRCDSRLLGNTFLCDVKQSTTMTYKRFNF